MATVEPGPIDVGTLARDRWVESTLGRLDLEQQIGQLMTQVVYGAEVTTHDPRNRSRYGVDTPAEVVERFGLGGVIYFAWSDNCGHPDQVRELSAGLQRAAAATGAGIPLDLSIDQETGRVTRIGPPATELPGAMALGATGSTDLTREAYTIVGRELAAMGLTTAAAPVADVNVNPANPVIGTRSFGSDPARVTAHVRAVVLGLHAGGVAATAKHFPGHGDTDVDSHIALPVITHDAGRWRAVDAPPFAAAVEAGVDVVMTAHLAFPTVDPSGDPATLSAPVLTGLLRDRLGFAGVISTDSLGMAGVRSRYPDGEIAVRALAAGVDQLLMSADQATAGAAVLDAVRAGRLSEQRIADSVRRILRLKFDRHRVIPAPAGSPLDRVGSPEHLATAARIADAAVTRLRGDALLPPEGTVLVLGPEAESAVLARLLTAAGRRVATGDATVPGAVVIVVGARPPDDGLTRAARESGAPVIGVLTGSPQLVDSLSDVPAVLAGYSGTEVALAAVTRVLVGARTPTGQLPVTLAGSASEHPDAAAELVNAEPSDDRAANA